MLDVLSLALALAIGILVAGAFNPVYGLRPRWAALVLQVSLGIGAGIGITSIMFLLLRVIGVASAASVFVSDVVLLGAAGFFYLRRSRAQQVADEQVSFRWTWVLIIAFGLAVLVVASRLVSMVQANPWGQWDALAIWNLRAKFLAGPVGSWRVAVGGLLADRMHPDYPLLLSSFIARLWKASGQMTPLAPIATSFLFLSALVGLLMSAVAIVRGTASAVLSGLVILATTSLLLLAPAQYSDIPLAYFFLATIALIVIGDGNRSALIWAGLFAGFAAWTKNEGLVFLIGLMAVSALLRRRLFFLLAGAVPGILLTLWLKFVVAPPADTLAQQTSSSILAKAADLARYVQIARAFADEVIHLGNGFTHPLILLAIVAIVCRWRLDANRRLAVLIGAITLAITFAADVAAFVITPSDLRWHLGTSFGRLILQLWPGALLLCFAVLGAVADPPSVVAPTVLSKKKRKRLDKIEVHHEAP